MVEFYTAQHIMPAERDSQIGVDHSGILTASSLNFTEEEFGNLPFEDVRRPDRFYSDELARQLKSTVFGQDHACEDMARTITRARSGFRDPNRPMGVKLYLGPTGVGKTELAKQTAKILFPENPATHTIRIDCANLAGPSSVTRLRGSDPKFVGFGTNTLIMPRHIQDGAVVIFDEIEKAHPEIWKWLMEVLEEGQTTLYLPTDEPDPNGSQGKKIVPKELKFHNTFIILTSNEGSAALHAARLQATHEAMQRPIGFHTTNTTLSTGNAVDYETIFLEGIENGRLSEFPEFLGRIGKQNMIVFNELEERHFELIFDKFLLQGIEAQTKNNPKGAVNLLVADNLKRWLIQQSRVDLYGARDIRATLESLLFQAVADYNESGSFAPGAIVQAYLSTDGYIRFRQSGATQQRYPINAFQDPT